MKYLILFLIFLPFATASSLGVSPSTLEFNTPFEEETITKEFTLYNPNTETIAFNIQEEKNIISFEPKEGTILANKAIKVRATLKNTPETETLILINSYTFNEQNIQPAIAVKTKISPITEKKESFIFEEVQSNDDSLYFVILNNGNIRSKAELEINIDEKTITQTISQINPGESEELDIKLNLKPGEYTAKAVLKNNNVIFSEKEIKVISKNKFSFKYANYIFIGLAILLSASMAFTYMKLRKK